MSTSLGTTAKNAADHQSDWKARLQRVLAQNRRALNFVHYNVSESHKRRMQDLAEKVPELYNNPDITPRSKWFQHPRFSENSQMPPYHIHFRQEIQSVLNRLYEAYLTEEPRHQKQSLSAAYRLFSGSMSGLNGHVSIEEYACFPIYQEEFPNVEIRFLYEDHTHLKESEAKLLQELEYLSSDACDKESSVSSKAKILARIANMLDFDDQLMAHLGEEEEIVVPMSLTEKDIWF